jgi:hypothetical protein
MMDKDDLRRTATGARGGTEAPEGFRSRMNASLIAWLIILAAAAIFFFRNSQRTELDFLFFKSLNKTRWLVIVCIGIGILLDRFFSIWWRRRRRAKAEARF